MQTCKLYRIGSIRSARDLLFTSYPRCVRITQVRESQFPMLLQVLLILQALCHRIRQFRASNISGVNYIENTVFLKPDLYLFVS